MNNDLAKIYKTFSGTDSLVFMLLPHTSPICLGSITTISYSIFRDKKPVPLIGKINVGGFTRGTRIIAGTMILTLINQHWVNDLLEQVPWLKKYGKIKCDELPIFDIMIVSANEYGAAVQMFIYGVDVTDEGQVLSIEDLFTENQISFVARDIDTFTDALYEKENFSKIKTIKSISNFDYSYNFDFNPGAFKNNWDGPTRNLKYVSHNIMTGEDVLSIQQKLNSRNIASPLNGIYDSTTYESVRKFQSQAGLPITGAIDDKTYMALDNSELQVNQAGIVISKNGSTVYEQPSSSSRPVGSVVYKEDVEVLDTQGDWILIDKGYVPTHLIYTSNDNVTVDIYPVLRYNDRGAAVTMLQEALNDVTGTELVINGIMDYETVEAVKVFEDVNGMPVDGIADVNVWMLLNEKSDYVRPEKVDLGLGFVIYYRKMPKTYDVQEVTFNPDEYGFTLVAPTKDTNIKLSAIATYPNGQSLEFTKNISVLKGSIDTIITADILSDAFMYNGKMGSTPNYIEFVVHFANGKPLKWTFNYK